MLCKKPGISFHVLKEIHRSTKNLLWCKKPELWLGARAWGCPLRGADSWTAGVHLDMMTILDHDFNDRDFNDEEALVASMSAPK